MRKVLHAFGLLPAARRGRAAINEAVENWKYRVQSFRLRREAAGFAIPPRKLNLMVTGTEDPEWYARGGWLAAQSIRFALERNAISVEGLTSILDFGCGAGRVIRHWAKLSALVHGTDYNPELIRCAQHLRFAEFRVNGLQPPLGYPSNSFDLVYALSVFTHLDEAGQFAWINELRRVVKPGGYLLITTHGMCPFYLKHLNQAEQEQLRAGNLVIRAIGPVGGNAYSAYHPVNYVRSVLAKGFAVVTCLEGGAFGNPYQDLYLLQKLRGKADGPVG